MQFHYEYLGRETVVRQLLDRFCDLMDDRAERILILIWEVSAVVQYNYVARRYFSQPCFDMKHLLPWR